METVQTVQTEQTADEMIEYAAHLMVNEKKNSYEAKTILMEKGMDEENAALMVENLQNQIDSAKNSRANKDMLYGALWCVGGIVATVADFGYIFWGAILFGGIQFVKGLVSSMES